MSRQMHGDQTAAYRAVIVDTWPKGCKYYPDGAEFTTYAGPYVTVGAAKAALTNAKRGSEWFRDQGMATTGHVEKSSVVWERVDDK